MEKPRLLRPNQVMERLNVSRAKVYRMIADGHFEALKIGGSLRITERSLGAYIERQILLYALENGEIVSDVS